MQTVYHGVILQVGTRVILIPLSKICPTCTPPTEKLLSEFNTDHRVAGGHKTYCRKCNAKYYHSGRATVAQRRAERDAIREQEKQNTPPKTSKVCPKCDPPVEKPLSEFYPRKGSKDGYGVYCKTCIAKESHDRLDKRREREQAKGEEFKQAKYAANKKWRAENAEEIRIRNREKYANDPEHAQRIRKHTAAWIATHPMEMREHQMRRKSRILQDDPISYTNILERDGACCYICGQSIDLTIKKKCAASLTFDHVIPLVPRPGNPQGTHTADNIKPTHNACNGRKSNRPFDTLTAFDRRGV